MKKVLVLFLMLFMGITTCVYGIDSQKQPVNVRQNKENQQLGEKREIKNIDEYFRYLSHEVQRNWTPYSADKNYEVRVQFTIHRDGRISDISIKETTFRDANVSVLSAVKKGIPYQPLPKSFNRDKVIAQIVLSYNKKQ